MGKLKVAFTTADHTVETAEKTFKSMVGILGETDQAVEASNHLAQLTKNEKELASWTNIAAGVYATFGDSLPLEGLTEAANETAKVGKVTGPLADALNWVGISEDQFNDKLAKCNNEKERSTLITNTLSKAYEEAGTEYREVNGDLIESREATAEFNKALADLASIMTPVITKITELATVLINKFNGLDENTKNIILKITLLAAAIGPVIIVLGQLISSGGVIFGVLSKISGAIAGVSAGTGTLSSVLTVLTGPVGIVIAAITALVGVFTYLYNTNEQFRIKAQETWNNLVNLFQNTVMPVINNLKNLVMNVINTIISILQQLWSFVEPFFTEMFMWLMDFWNNTGSEIFENVMGFVNGLIDLVSMIWNNVISPLINFLLENLKPAFSFVFGFISEVVQNFGNTIGSIIKSITGIFKGIIDFITGVFSGNWEKAWQGIKDIFKNIVSGLANIIKSPINNIISLINGFINGINKVKVPDWVPSIGGKGINIPKIPYLAKGGIVDKATLAMIGEGKSAEAVIPLDNTLTKYMAEALREAGGRNNSIVVNFYPQQMTEAELNNAFNYINRKFGILY